MLCPQRLLRFLLLRCAKHPGVGWQGKGDVVAGEDVSQQSCWGTSPAAERYGGANAHVLLAHKLGDAAASRGVSAGQGGGPEPPMGHGRAGGVGVAVSG